MFAWLWFACGDSKGPGDGDPLDTCPSEPQVVLGTGLQPVVPLEEGAELLLVHGPQGGWHVDVGGLVTIPTLEVAVNATLVLDGRQLAGDQSPLYTVLAAYDDATCDGEFYEVRAYVDDELATLPGGTDVLLDYICPLGGQRVTLTVEVSDIDREVVLTDTIEGVIVLDPYDVSACTGG